MACVSDCTPLRTELGTNSKKDDVIPAKARIHNANENNKLDLCVDSGFRGNDEILITV